MYEELTAEIEKKWRQRMEDAEKLFRKEEKRFNKKVGI
jgi:hypothetical protein